MSYQRGAMYSPDKEMFICETEAQRDELADRGWLSLPDTYSPDEAMWVQFIPEVKESVEPKSVKAKLGRPKA